MSLHWPKAGINHVPEFQVSGHTLVITGSSETIYLTHVASSITLSADGADKEVTFYDGGHTGIAFTVPQDTTARFKGKFLTFSVPAGADALVEITNIPSSSYSVPTFAAMHRTTNGGST
jgi:hypothetical protein